MQGPPPISPQFSSPPGKKQRAGNTPQSPQDRQDRRAELLRLSRSPSSNLPSANFLMNQARSTLGTQPMMPAGSLRPTAIPLRNGGGRPAGAAGPPPPSVPPIFGMGHQNTNADQKLERPPMGAENGTAANRVPGRASIPPQPRSVFPNTPKPSQPHPPSPKTPTPVTTPPSTKSNGLATAAALKNSDDATNADERIARRLETQFTPNKNGGNRSRSAPPSRPPPPPGPPQQPPGPPQQQGLPKGVGKTVTFAASPKTAISAERPPEETPTAPPPPRNRNGTPFPKNGASQVDAGHTPFHPSDPQDFDSPELDRRNMLLQMRQLADTPAEKENPSPELRMQKELTTVTKEKANALRQVFQLEGEIQELKEKQEQERSRVGFLSPILSASGTAGRVWRKTPHPKRRAQTNGTTPSEREIECLEAAANSVPFEYENELDEGEQQGVITMQIRRPFGLDAGERDLWFRVGYQNAKLYRKSASIDYASTLEIATTPLPDGSVLSLHGAAEHVHHLMDGTDQPNAPLRTIQYIDDEGNEKEYDLERVYDNLVDARSEYCTAVRLTADALLQQPPAVAAPPRIPATPPRQEPPPKETNEKGTETEPIKEVSPKTVEEQQYGQDEAPDSLGTAAYLLFYIFALPFRLVFGLLWSLLTSSLFYGIVAVLLAIGWVHLKNQLGGGTAGILVHMNIGGVV